MTTIKLLLLHEIKDKEIKYSKEYEIKTLFIFLTKDKNIPTVGTAIIFFLFPDFLKKSYFLKAVSFEWQNKKKISDDIKIIFKNGEPFLIKVTLFFLTSIESFNFYEFLSLYSRENQLVFFDPKSFD